MKVSLILAETLKKQELNFSLYALFHIKNRVTFKYFVSYCLWKHFLDSNLPQTSSNLISLKFLVTLIPFTLFEPKIRAFRSQKSPKLCLTWLLLSRSFHWVWDLVLKEFQVSFRTFFKKIKKIVVDISLVLTDLAANKSITSKRNVFRQSVSVLRN